MLHNNHATQTEDLEDVYQVNKVDTVREVSRLMTPTR